jgi:hypothetical protein
MMRLCTSQLTKLGQQSNEEIAYSSRQQQVKASLDAQMRGTLCTVCSLRARLTFMMPLWSPGQMIRKWQAKVFQRL